MAGSVRVSRVSTNSLSVYLFTQMTSPLNSESVLRTYLVRVRGVSYQICERLVANIHLWPRPFVQAQNPQGMARYTQVQINQLSQAHLRHLILGFCTAITDQMSAVVS